MPTFCRHNRLVSNCPICAREQHVELRPVVSPGGRPAPEPRTERASTPSPSRSRGASRPGARSGMTVRRMAREAADDYRSTLVPGIKSGADAERLAAEMAFAATRLDVLAADPPGLYAEVADPAGDVEERTWLALQIAEIGPLDTPFGAQAGSEPFAAIEAVRTSWASGEIPALAGVEPGPRTGLDAARAPRALRAYRAWSQRVGSQAAGIEGETAWTPERRFDRVFERLGSQASLPRGTRYELLVSAGRLGLFELSAASLHLGGDDPVTLAAKRILGIGDPLLLQRRAQELAQACGLALAALDLGFFNWERRERATMGVPAGTEPDPELLAGARAALELD